jgi:hypothetical protein
MLVEDHQALILQRIGDYLPSICRISLAAWRGMDCATVKNHCTSQCYIPIVLFVPLSRFHPIRECDLNMSIHNIKRRASPGSLRLNGLLDSASEEQDGQVADAEVDEAARLVGHERPEVGAHDALPSGAVGPIELLQKCINGQSEQTPNKFKSFSGREIQEREDNAC